MIFKIKVRMERTPQSKLQTAMRQVCMAGAAQLRLGKSLDELDTETAIYEALKNLLKEDKITQDEYEQLARKPYTTSRPIAD